MKTRVKLQRGHQLYSTCWCDLQIVIVKEVKNKKRQLVRTNIIMHFRIGHTKPVTVIGFTVVWDLKEKSFTSSQSQSPSQRHITIPVSVD